MAQDWYHEDRLHRERDGPAEIRYYVSGTIRLQRWWRDGLYHREGDRPAQIEYSESGAMVSQSYYRYGIQVKPCH